MDNSVDKDEVEESDAFLWDQSLIRNSLQDSDSPLDLETEGSQVTELTPRAPRKLGVPLVIRKGNKGRLDLKAAGKRTRAESDSDEKEEPLADDDEAERQKKGTKRKKSGSTKLGLKDLIGAWGEDNKVEAHRIETAKLKWSAKMLEYCPTEREKDRALKQQELEIQQARMIMEKAQFVLTYGITAEDFFKKFKDRTSMPITIERTSVGNTPAAASTPASALKFNTQVP
ncbi:hypothetical protein L211DRAFT_849599 [Terfezia boudieri ATCC MYA-4762]|uniref:No apical meristem-associated C-terminal domain-containing protein n=1 Tax=Terfezia boudieri ATCC MYA-4762 TaxID=1051890 RepID=A0A3N4LQ08_9PEZI|nr:hypothetical protein L211DRAFT_849599 [Terfezia boudieri ATCC MYA-4762]